MSEGFIRHFISFVATLIVILTFYAGYLSGISRWWWIGLLSFIVYLIVYKILEV
ncbi:hypothetical protein HOF40_03795 [Candidatus Parcubacteria bacterium]|jgi:hypothetical protein|nr:hypothetical protein [Candidatus Parcubacteria bacterium]MBT3949183.1 hypothetical protein [Candidatus Parcubacteria bacterium]